MIFCNLGYILEEKGIKPFPLSKDLNLPRSFINALIDNTFQTLNIESIEKLCVHLDLKYEDLFDFYPIYLSFGLSNEEGLREFPCPFTVNVSALGYGEDDDITRFNKSFRFYCHVDTTDLHSIKIDIDDDDYEEWCNYVLLIPSLTWALESNYLNVISLKIEQFITPLLPSWATLKGCNERIIYDKRKSDQAPWFLHFLKERIEERLKEEL